MDTSSIAEEGSCAVHFTSNSLSGFFSVSVPSKGSVQETVVSGLGKRCDPCNAPTHVYGCYRLRMDTSPLPTNYKYKRLLRTSVKERVRIGGWFLLFTL